MQADVKPFGGGGTSGSSSTTTNLVRLLRKAEEGKGLEIDYSDALSEALGQGNYDGTDAPRAVTQQQRGARSSSLLLGRVPSLGRKRYVHSTWGRVFESTVVYVVGTPYSVGGDNLCPCSYTFPGDLQHCVRFFPRVRVYIGSSALGVLWGSDTHMVLPFTSLTHRRYLVVVDGAAFCELWRKIR